MKIWANILSDNHHSKFISIFVPIHLEIRRQIIFFREPDFIVYFDKLDTLILDHNCLNSKTVFPRMQKQVKYLIH